MENRQKITKVPMVMQREMLECGAASLTMILEYYNKWVSLEEVRVACDVSRDGSKAGNIMLAGRNFGLDAHGFRYSVRELKEKVSFPCILHWNLSHFVVCKGFKNGKAYINDPALGERCVSEEEFNSSYTGIVLTFAKGENFKEEGKKRSFSEYVRKRLAMSKSALIFVLITTAILAVVGMIKPTFTRIFFDGILSGNGTVWFLPFMIGLSVLLVVETVVTAIQAKYTLRLNGKMDITSTGSFMWRLIRMPMRFFSQRMAGDLQSRLDQNADIASMYVNTFAPLILQAGMAVFYLIIMLQYSVMLTIVGLIAVALNLASINLIQKKNLNLNRRINSDSGKLDAFTLNAIEMIETLKSSGAERGYFETWAGYQAQISNNKTFTVKTQIYYSLIPQIASALSNTVVSALGIYLVIQSEFTIGMITAFAGFLSAFMKPVDAFSSAADQIQSMRISAERVEDVMSNPIDVRLEAHDKDKITEGKLSGRIEIKDITFGYSTLSKPLIENLSLSIKPGEKIAFVGSTGCGKSTMANLIAGLYEPKSGEILYDGVKISEIDRNVFNSSVSVVDQEIILFEDTIRNNICMWDDTIPETDVYQAAKDAQIHSDIMHRAGGYGYRISEGGRDFSGGQRQRLEIARSLVTMPSILIMDEATSALDAITEKEVMDAVSARNITCILIAHRLSSIRDCDRIYMLENGKIVEQGTHEELFALNGRYTNLINSEFTPEKAAAGRTSNDCGLRGET